MCTPAQEQVIALLAAGQSVTAAAAALDLHRTTIHHWKRTDPDFADALRDAQADASAAARALYAPHAAAALAVLIELMNNPNTAASVRLKAALYVLTQAATPAPPPQTREERQDARLLRLSRQSEIDASAEPIHQNSSDLITPAAAEPDPEPEPETTPDDSSERNTTAGFAEKLAALRAQQEQYEAYLEAREARLNEIQQNSSPATAA